MDVVKLIERAKADGVLLSVAGGELQIEADTSERHWLAKLRPHKADIVRVLSGEPSVPPATSNPPIDHFVPFPVDALPESLRAFVVAGAMSIGCDESFIALPSLAACGAAIGTTRRIELKRGWTEPAIVWVAVVGDSGTTKTPAFKLAMAAVRRQQSEAFARYNDDLAQYEVDRAMHDKAMGVWKKSKSTNDPPPEKPEPPHPERYLVSDTTTEALAPILLHNPRGVLLARDELAGWVGSFDRYAGGKGGDSAHWLSMHSAESITVDRKTGHPPTIHVPIAAVSIAGSIQPRVLQRALSSEHRESGLAARLLFAQPPVRIKRWTEADIEPDIVERVNEVLRGLYALEHDSDDDGQLVPRRATMTAEAKRAWVAFYNAHNRQQSELSGDLAAAWSKLEAYAARFALLVHYVRVSAGDLPADGSLDDIIGESDIRAGIELATWFKHEARRVYAMLGESDDDRENRKLAEWIERKHDGRVTARQVQQGRRDCKCAEDAEAMLDALADAGYGAWSIESTATNQRRDFVLHEASTSTDSPSSGEIHESVDVDSVDTPETPARQAVTI